MKNPLEVLIEIKDKIEGIDEQGLNGINEDLALLHNALINEICGIIEITLEDIKNTLK